MDPTTHSIGLLTLPNNVIVKILSEIPLCDLLLSVNRTCKRLNEIIEHTSTLWKDISTEYCCLVAGTNDLKRILKHSVGFETFLIPFADLSCHVFEIDFLLSTQLCKAKQLYWLDISQCKVSTLCFVQYLPSLRILNVSECNNLVDQDFSVIATCKNLDHLYISYTNILPCTVVYVCTKLELLVLDLSGIRMTVNQCDSIIFQCMVAFYTSLVHADDHADAVKQLKQTHLDCSIHIV